ncbi:MAG TPA: polyprenol phosphomannose-dependent alpha 1,6 mannosyltransferase MptB [Dermatophilaceae bacterium]|nr:polyprenol phosphomannose-dependent alpha 1,6 mannosyltransferase MptB [Dermatophilaceae bacterium]
MEGVRTRTAGSAGLTGMHSMRTVWWPLLRADIVHAWSILGVRRGFVGMVLIGLGSMGPAFLPPDAPILDQLHLSWLNWGPLRLLLTGVLLVGVLLLVDGWLRLRPGGSRPRVPVVTWALWSMPILLTPPLFSRDAYSYAAQGLVVSRGMDPYQTGPIAVPGPFADQVDTSWLYTAAPYGPIALQVQHFVVWLTGGNAYAAAVGMRLPALLSLAVIAYALPRLARRLGVSTQQAVWLGVLNPLVVLHLVGGAHNDAMMIALVCLGLLLASRGHLVWASLAIAGAAGFKQTAVLALVAVAGLVMRSRGEPMLQRRYLRLTTLSGVVATTGFAVLTQLTGLGWGWVLNLSVPASMRSLLSPPTFVGSIAEGTMYLMGLSKSWQAVPVPLMQTLGGLTALAVIVWMALRVAPRSPIAAAAGALTALCLGGPVIHPWYLLWGGVLFGAMTLSRRLLRICILVSLFLVAYSAIDAAVANGYWTLALTVVALLAWRSRSSQGRQPEWRDKDPARSPLPPVDLLTAR